GFRSRKDGLSRGSWSCLSRSLRSLLLRTSFLFAAAGQSPATTRVRDSRQSKLAPGPGELLAHSHPHRRSRILVLQLQLFEFPLRVSFLIVGAFGVGLVVTSPE